MDRDVGKLGERAAAAWYTEAGMHVNSSYEEDKKGWDHLVQFTLDDDEVKTAGVPPDQDFREVTSFIQVKSTDKPNGGGQRLSLKLSNWKYLTTGTTDPCFILRLEFDGMDEPQRSYLIHVGEDLIERALERLRELSGEDTRPREKEMSLTYGKGSRLKDENGRAVRDKIVGTINGDPKEYKRWKRRYFENVGYGKQRIRVRGSFAIPEGYEGDQSDYHADVAAGIKPSADLKVDEAEDLRFDNPTTLSSSPDQIKLWHEYETEEMTLVFKDLEDGSRRTRITADLYHPKDFMEEVPVEKRRLRFSTPYADLIVAEAGQTLRLETDLPSGEVEIRLADLRPVGKLLRVFRDRSPGQKLSFECNSDSRRIEFGTFLEKNLQIVQVGAFPKTDSYVLSNWIGIAWETWKLFDVQSRAKVTIDSLKFNYEKYQTFAFANSLGMVPITFLPEYGGKPWKYKTGEPYEEYSNNTISNVAIPCPLTISTPTHSLIVGLILVGKPDRLSKKEGCAWYKLTPQQPIKPQLGNYEAAIVYCDVFSKGERFPFDSLPELHKFCAGKVEGEDLFVHEAALTKEDHLVLPLETNDE